MSGRTNAGNGGIKMVMQNRYNMGIENGSQPCELWQMLVTQQF